MATVTSTPTATSLKVNGTTTRSGTISWTNPTIPSGATITSCVLTGTATANMSRYSATIKVNNQTVTSGSTFTVNLGTGNTTTSVTTSAVGNNRNASGTVTFSNLVYTVTYEVEESTVGGINLGYSIAKSLYVGLKKILYVYVGNSLVYGGNLNVDPPIDVVNLLVPFENWGMDDPSQATITTMQGNNLNIVVRGAGGSPYTLGMNLVANKTYTIKADSSTVGLIMCDSSWGNWTEISRDELLAGYVFMSSATFTIMGLLLTTEYPCTATISNLMVTEGGEFVEVILPPFEKWGADNSNSISVITCSGGNLRATVTAGDGYPYVTGGVKIYMGERYTVKADSSNVDLMLIDETWEYNSNTIIITSSQMVAGYTFTASANYIFVGFIDSGTYPFTIDVVNLTATRS